MSENKYDDMTASMKDYVATTMKELLTPALLDNAQHDAALKFRRFAMQSPIPSHELAGISKVAEIRALREVMDAIKAQPYESDEARFAAFAKLRENYTESGKARYLIEHGVPEDTSNRYSEGSAAGVAMMGQAARKTIEAISYDVLTGAQKKLKP